MKTSCIKKILIAVMLFAPLLLKAEDQLDDGGKAKAAFEARRAYIRDFFNQITIGDEIPSTLPGTGEEVTFSKTKKVVANLLKTLPNYRILEGDQDPEGKGWGSPSWMPGITLPGEDREVDYGFLKLTHEKFDDILLIKIKNSEI